jgi:hypothetical protein
MLGRNTVTRAVPLRSGAWGREMTAKSKTLEAAEKDLKELMDDVTRAIEKAQQAVARITGKSTVAAAGAEATTPSQ